MFKLLFYLVTGLAILLIITFILSCEDNPVAPKNDELKDYTVYIWETDHAGEHFYMGYHPASGIIDTFTAEDGPSWCMKTSADGQFLFVPTKDYVAKVDLETKTTIASLPYRADNGISVSQNNELIAISMGPGLVIIRVSDFSVVYEDTLLDFLSISFSSDSKKLYGFGVGSYHSVVIMNLEDNYSLSSTELTPGLVMIKVLPSIDESKWFIIWRYNMYTNIFEVYDVSLDSIIFREWVYGGSIDLINSPDGKYVFYTESGNETDLSGTNYFTIYDVSRNRVKMKISTVGIEDGINPEFMALGQMAMTPDGKWLIIGEALGGASFIRFNMITMQIDDYIQGEMNEDHIYMEGYNCYTCQINQ